MTNEFAFRNQIYLTIPKEWSNTYYKLLSLLGHAGKHLVYGCKSDCSSPSIFDCWNMFQAALAAYTLADYDTANKLHDKIARLLNTYSKSQRITLPVEENNVPMCAYSFNDDVLNVTVQATIDGEVCTKVFSLPDKTSHVLYYGVASATKAEQCNVFTLEKILADSVDVTLTIPTEESDVVWFVSDVPLSFVQSNLTLNLEEEHLGDYYYYHTVPLQAVDFEVSIVERQ